LRGWWALALRSSTLLIVTKTIKGAVNKEVNSMVNDNVASVLQIQNIRINDRNQDITKRWYIDMELIYSDGSKLRKIKHISSARYPTLVERNKYVKRLSKALENWQPDNKPLKIFFKSGIKDQFDEMLQVKFAETKKKRTIQTYRSDINIFFEFLELNNLSAIKVSEFLQFHALAFSDYLLTNRGNGNLTRNNVVRRVSHNFEMIKQRTNLIEDNPFAKVKKLKTTISFQHVAFTPEDQILVENEIQNQNDNLYFFTRFMYYCFTRVDETINLRVSNIDAEKRILTVYSVVQKTSITLHKVIPTKLWQMIRNRGILDLPQDHYIFSKYLKPGNLKCGLNYPANKCREILKQLGIYKPNHYSLYSFRHTGIDRMIENNVDVDLVDLQNHIGHQKIETTMNYTKARKLRISRKLEDRDW
jgi:integrase